MPSRTALGAAAGLALTVAGGVSALLLTIGPVESSSAETVDTSNPTTATGTDVVVEYVDQYGNPVDLSDLRAATPGVASAVTVPGPAPAAGYDDDHEGDGYGDHDRYEDAYGEHDDD